MKVLEFKRSEFDISRVGKRLFDLNNDALLEYFTDEGVYRIWLKKGFRFNGRSGPSIIDFYLPNLADDDYNAAVGGHDACFDVHCFSFKVSNALFRGALLCIGRKPEKVMVAFRFVSSFIGKFIYWRRQDKINVGKVTYSLDAK